VLIRICIEDEIKVTNEIIDKEVALHLKPGNKKIEILNQKLKLILS